MQPLNQAFGRAGAQYCHQTDAVIGLPRKLDRLAFQLLPEAVAMQRVTGDTRPDHRHQRQPLTQAQFSR